MADNNNIQVLVFASSFCHEVSFLLADSMKNRAVWCIKSMRSGKSFYFIYFNIEKCPFQRQNQVSYVYF